MIHSILTYLVLLFMVASTYSQYYTSFSPAITYDRYYGRTLNPQTSYKPTSYSRSSYVPAYSASKYKTPHRTVLNVPLCKAGGTILLKVFVEKDSKPVLNAKVSYVDNKGMKTISTNQYGLASITAYGCIVALMVYHKEDNPVYKTVDLLSCTTRTEKVVIKVDDKCNFNLHFTYKAISGTADDCTICGDEHQLVSFFYNSTYVHTGHGEAVAKTVCITAGQQGDNLKVVLQSQYSNVISVLDITLTDSRTAVMALPPQLPTAVKFEMGFTSNTYQHGELLLNEYSDWVLVAQTGTNIVLGDANAFTATSSFSAAVGVNELAGDRWLLAVSFVGTDSNSVDLEGNVVVIDLDCNYQSVEHPDTDSADYTPPDDWFVVGCFCNNAPSMKVGDFFPVGLYDTTATPSFATYCDDKCM